MNVGVYLLDTQKIAKRSPFKTHKTGCIVVDGIHVVSNGWSHIPAHKIRLRSLHAEMHALARCRHIELKRPVAFIVNVAVKSGNPTTAKPCLNCAIALKAAGVSMVYYSIPEGFDVLYLDGYLDQMGLKVYNSGDN